MDELEQNKDEKPLAPSAEGQPDNQDQQENPSEVQNDDLDGAEDYANWEEDPYDYEEDPSWQKEPVKNDTFAEESDEDGSNMTLLEHLEAFRWTLIYSLIGFVIGAGVVGIFLGDISRFIQYPLSWAYGSAELARQNLITYRPMGVFTVLLQVVFLGGFILSMPFMLYVLARFIAPALNERELRVVKPCCVASIVLFLLGVLFSFFIVLPMTLAVSIRFNRFFGFDLLFAASEYYSLVVWFSLAMGMFFQFPLIILLLVFMEVVTTQMLKAFRRHVFLGLVIFAALITPGGDPISLLIMTAPMYGFYELSMLIGRRIERNKMQAADIST
jgi:sec-independent protein translocase protein TatC